MTQTPGPQAPVGAAAPTGLEAYLGYMRAGSSVADPNNVFLCEEGIAYRWPFGNELLVASQNPNYSAPGVPLN